MAFSSTLKSSVTSSSVVTKVYSWSNSGTGNTGFIATGLTEIYYAQSSHLGANGPAVIDINGGDVEFDSLFDNAAEAGKLVVIGV